MSAGLGTWADTKLSVLRDRNREVLVDWGSSVQIRRGSTTLGAQTVRFVRSGSGRRNDRDSIEQQEYDVLVVGDTDLDIQPGDRLNDDNGDLYEVQRVRPDQRVRIAAEAILVQ